MIVLVLLFCADTVCRELKFPMFETTALECSMYAPVIAAQKAPEGMELRAWRCTTKPEQTT